MSQYVDRTFGKFDPAKPLVAARQMTLLGHEVGGGDLISNLKDANDVPIDSDVLRRLWMTRWADYQEDYRPTPVQEEPADEGEEDEDTTGVSYAHTGGGWYEVTAPWLATPIKVKGEEAAKTQAAELREKAPPPGATSEGEGEGDDTQTGEGGEGEEDASGE